MAEDLVLPVPTVLSALYLVPSALTGEAAREQALAALPAHVADRLVSVAAQVMETSLATVDSQPAAGMPPLPVKLQHYMGVPEDLIAAVSGASEFAVITVGWLPGWPPVHEIAARAMAAALASDLGVPVVDAFVPKVLAPATALASLPGADDRIKLADWILVFQSQAEHGLWMTTKGLGRFGLPELQVLNVPPQLGRPWTSIMTGLASRLLGMWVAAVRESGTSGFGRVPALIGMSEADVANAYASTAAGNGSAVMRLTFDPTPAEHSDSFLTVQPPDDYAGSAGEFMTDVCEAMFGSVPPDIRYLQSSEAMDKAMQMARAALPAIRSRFVAGELPLGARLIVKHRLESPGGTEFPWAYVSSWKEPGTILANSADDASVDKRIRAGRPIVIDARTVVDWAVWEDGKGIVEGGETNKVALREGRRGTDNDGA